MATAPAASRPYDRAGRDADPPPDAVGRPPAGGFTTGEPWLPPIDPAARNVADQRARPRLAARALPRPHRAAARAPGELRAARRRARRARPSARGAARRRAQRQRERPREPAASRRGRARRATGRARRRRIAPGERRRRAGIRVEGPVIRGAIAGRPLGRRTQGRGDVRRLAADGGGHRVMAVLVLCAARRRVWRATSELRRRTTLTWFIFNEPSGALAGDRRQLLEAVERASTRSSSSTCPSHADQQREQLVRRLGAKDYSHRPPRHGRRSGPASSPTPAGSRRSRRRRAADAVTEKRLRRASLQTARFKDQLYAAPIWSNTQLLWYRKDRVPTPPKTWDEMIDEAEKLGPDKGQIEVQANSYEGLVVWVNSLDRVGRRRRSSTGPEEIDARQGPDREGARRSWASSRTRRTRPTEHRHLDRGHRRASRFEAGNSAFMINYPFVYPSAKANAPDVFKQMAAAQVPAGRPEPAEQARRSAASTSASRAYSKHQDGGLRGDPVPGQAGEPARDRRAPAACRPCARTSTTSPRSRRPTRASRT